MDYSKDLLNKLLDIYERRNAFQKEASALRAIQIEVKKAYPAYADRYNHHAYREINAAIEKLTADGLAAAEPDDAGRYTKVRLHIEKVQECYTRLHRESIPKQCENVLDVLKNFQGSTDAVMQRIVSDFTARLKAYKKLPYELKYDQKKTAEVLMAIQEILKLEKETYIRNFSTALFKDSKRFQREFRSAAESILFDHTEEVVEKEKILEFYNLYENPTYVLIKGEVQISFQRSVIYAAELPDGIALSSASLEEIKTITVNAQRVITVENLTAYHDSDEKDAVHIYLGGYHNRAKQKLLEKLYAENRSCTYFHKGDLDVYGFLILENLKEKTGIPFLPLMMDVCTLERFSRAGLCKALTANDRKVIKAKKKTLLAAYEEVLEYMLEKNIKVEQESIKAAELLRSREKEEF